MNTRDDSIRQQEAQPCDECDDIRTSDPKTRSCMLPDEELVIDRPRACGVTERGKKLLDASPAWPW